MKQHSMSLLRSTLSDRWLSGLLIANGIVMIIVIISIATMIEPRETQVITQYSAFGGSGFYRGYWYTLWAYALLELILVIGNGAFSLRLVRLERREFGLALLWLTLGLSSMALLFARAIIKIAALG